MSEPIKVGDLVELRGSCCASSEHLRGRYGIVVDYSPIGSSCGRCSRTTPGAAFRVPDLMDGWDQKYGGWFPTSWLRKIPPFPELADEKTDDRIPKPVLK